jgi:hypothetical protein
MSSSSATIRPVLTAVTSAQPLRAFTVAAVCAQHLLSARKIMSGLALISASAESCG